MAVSIESIKISGINKDLKVIIKTKIIEITIQYLLLNYRL